MTIMRVFTFLLVLTGVFAVTASAQRTTKKPVRKPVTTTVVKPVVPADVQSAKQTASNQLSNVSGYLKKFTPIAPTMDSLGSDERAGKLSKRAATDYGAAKRNVLIQIRDFKAGLTSLENDFRLKSSLLKYFPKLQGITDLSTSAEVSAQSGRFVAVKDALAGIVQRLNDTVIAMP
jgi:hypothetical protein